MVEFFELVCAGPALIGALCLVLLLCRGYRACLTASILGLLLASVEYYYFGSGLSHMLLMGFLLSRGEKIILLLLYWTIVSSSAGAAVSMWKLGFQKRSVWGVKRGRR